MDLATTLTVLGAAAAVFVPATWRHRQPYRPGRIWAPPWLAIMSIALVAIMSIALVAIMSIALVAILLVLAHLLTLWRGTSLAGPAGF